MNIYEIQQSIVKHLQDQFSLVNVPFDAEDLPETSTGYKNGLARPIAYVYYAGGKGEPSVSINTQAQPRKLRFNVDCHARLMYTANGLYVLRDLVEQALLGFEPVNCHRLYYLADDIGQTEEKIWVHVFQFECETMFIQKPEDRPIMVPSFKGLNNQD